MPLLLAAGALPVFLSISAQAAGLNLTSSHSADKCQAERVPRSLQHGRYCPQKEADLCRGGSR